MLFHPARFRGSFIFGFFVFIAAILILAVNENNLIKERSALSEIGKNVIPADSKAPSPENNGKIIHLTGYLDTADGAFDPGIVSGGPFLKLERFQEVFQWEEKNTGDAKSPKYEYVQTWSERRINSDNFHINDPTYTNPPQSVFGKSSALFTASQAALGNYDGSAIVEHITCDTDVMITADMIEDPNLILDNNYLYRKTETEDSVGYEIGDIRYHYKAAVPGIYSVIARQFNLKYLEAYNSGSGKEKFLVQKGSRSHENMIAAAGGRAKGTAVFTRIFGFIVMFIATFAVLSRLTFFTNFIPVVGGLTRGVILILSFIVSLITTIVVSLLSMILFNPFLLALLIIVLFFGGISILRKKGRQAQAPSEK